MAISSLPVASATPSVPNVLWTNVPTGMTLRQTFTTSGTWTNPGVSQIYVICIGGGGGGGGSSINAGTYSHGGGGGGGVNQALINVTGNQTVTIGAGGVGGISGQTGSRQRGGRGGTTSFGNNTSAAWLLAPGGNGASSQGGATNPINVGAGQGANITSGRGTPYTYNGLWIGGGYDVGNPPSNFGGHSGSGAPNNSPLSPGQSGVFTGGGGANNTTFSSSAGGSGAFAGGAGATLVGGGGGGYLGAGSAGVANSTGGAGGSGGGGGGSGASGSSWDTGGGAGGSGCVLIYY